ncbi:hypothetical protein, partial [Streptococcus sobrinus]|uniref:hypothetical protein n=1 Tax=Streptococcus sobrinus TaxID=1310 RepID=UPI0005B3F20D
LLEIAIFFIDEFNKLKKFTGDVTKAIQEFFQKMWDKTKEIFLTTISAIKSGVETSFNAVADFIKAIGEKIVGFFKSSW